MKGLTAQEAITWCSQKSTGLRLGKRRLLSYLSKNTKTFYITAPEGHRQIVFLTRLILSFDAEGSFAGGLLWLRGWAIGTPELESVGWLILESIRRVNGETRSLEAAPAQLFREDEFLPLHASLVQAIAFGWVTEFVPRAGRFFFHFKSNRQIGCSAESADTLKALRTALGRWNPTDEDPMVARMASLAKNRKQAGGKDNR
jgi:hypothetical protein